MQETTDIQESPQMQVTDIVPNLSVPDLTDSQGFYRDYLVLGSASVASARRLTRA